MTRPSRLRSWMKVAVIVIGMASFPGVSDGAVRLALGPRDHHRDKPGAQIDHKIARQAHGQQKGSQPLPLSEWLQYSRNGGPPPPHLPFNSATTGDRQSPFSAARDKKPGETGKNVLDRRGEVCYTISAQ